MTISLSVDQLTATDHHGEAAAAGGVGEDEGVWAVTAPSQDCDCWLGFDKEDGFIFCVWNYSTGELREVCMRFITQLHLSSSEKEEGGSDSTGADGMDDMLSLTCSLLVDESETETETEREVLPPPPPSSSGNSECTSVLAIRFVLRQSGTPSADKFRLSELHSILQQARSMPPADHFATSDATDTDTITPTTDLTTAANTAANTTTNSGKSSRSSGTKRGSGSSIKTKRTSGGSLRRASVYSTSSKRATATATASPTATPTAPKVSFPGVSSLIEKFSAASTVVSTSDSAAASTSTSTSNHDSSDIGSGSGGKRVLVTRHSGSVRHIFGSMDEVEDEDQ